MSNPLITASDLIRAIPQKWRDAEIFIYFAGVPAEKIARVSLHRDDNGRRVILIHDERVRTKTVAQKQHTP